MAKKTARKPRKPAGKPGSAVDVKAAEYITLNDVMIVLQVAKETLDNYGPSPDPMTPPAHLLRVGNIIEAVRAEIETFDPERAIGPTAEIRSGNFGSRGCGLC